MPRKMAGSAMSRMLLLTIAISMPSVVLESTIHLYHLPCGRGSLTGENNPGCAVMLAVPSLSCGCAAARPGGRDHRVEQCPQGTCRTRQASPVQRHPRPLAAQQPAPPGAVAGGAAAP